MSTLREAAQQMLKEAEQAASVMWVLLDDYFEAMNNLREALAQGPESTQKPVRWLYINKKTGENTYYRHRLAFVDHSTTIEAALYAAPVESTTIKENV